MQSKFLQNKTLAIVASGILTLIISLLDFYWIAPSIFYLLPIILVTWFVNVRLGLVFSFISFCLWYMLDNIPLPPAQNIVMNTMVQLWNGPLAYFVLGTLLVAKLKKVLEIQERLARIDFLTGIPNCHDFSDILFLEMERSRRYERPLTLVYIDCDHFKKVNDTLGHAQGDLLLKEVANCLLEHTRKIDKIARMGGDEFTILLTETNETQAREILLRLFVKLLTVMELYKWPVTFSIGAVTFEDLPLTTQDAIREADKMMQQAKQNGRNQLATRTIRSVVEQANKRWT